MDISTDSLQDEAPEIPKLSCEKHVGKYVEYFCASHKTLICDSCKDLTHRKCTFADLDKEVADMKKSGSFEAITKQLETLKTEYSKLRKERENNKTEMESQIETCINKIKESRKEIDKVLDALESEMLEKVANIGDELSSEIEKHCKTIDETLKQLDNRRQMLELCKKSFDNQAKYFGVTYVKNEIQEMQRMKSDIELELREISITFQPNIALNRLLSQAKQFGKVVLCTEKQTDVPSLVNLSLTKPSKYNINSKTILATSFMADGKLLVACGTDGVKLLDDKFIQESSISNHAFDIAPVNSTEAIVAQGTKQTLQFLTTEPALKPGRVLKMDRKCWQVNVNEDNIMVVCHDNPGKGEVRILDMKGVFQRRLGIDCRKLALLQPSCVRVSKQTGAIFVSDMATNLVLCLDGHGNIESLISDMELMRPSGIHIDDHDNILVCGKDSGNAVVFSREGRKEKTIALPKNMVERPTCMSFRKSDGCFVIGSADCDEPLVSFQSEWKGTQGALSYVYGWFGWK